MADKISRGHASQFFVAGELCRRELTAVVTLGNTPNVDILCSNQQGTRFAHIQVKTFEPGKATCTVGVKATLSYGESFFWVLGGIPIVGSGRDFEYYIIPSLVMAENVTRANERYLATPGKKGAIRKDNTVRLVHLPPHQNPYTEWDISEYRDRWDLIEQHLS